METAAPHIFCCNCFFVSSYSEAPILVCHVEIHPVTRESHSVQPQQWPEYPGCHYPHLFLPLGRLHFSCPNGQAAEPQVCSSTRCGKEEPDPLCSEGCTIHCCSITASFLLFRILWIARLPAKALRKQTPWCWGQSNVTCPCITPSPSPFSCDVLEGLQEKEGGETFWWAACAPSHLVIPRCLDASVRASYGIVLELKYVTSVLTRAEQ